MATSDMGASGGPATGADSALPVLIALAVGVLALFAFAAVAAWATANGVAVTR